MARTLREVLVNRLACYEAALTLAEADIRRGVASADRQSSCLIVGDDLLRVCERYRLLQTLVAELRAVVGAAIGDTENPPAGRDKAA